MDIRIGYKRDYITYGTVVSLMLDYSDPNEGGNISYDPQNFYNSMSQNTSDNIMDYLTSKEFLYTHGVFNEYCYLHRFKTIEDFRNGYLNTAFIILPAFEFESMDNLNKLIKKAQKTGISEVSETGEVTQEHLYDNFIKFQQEILTNHDKTLKLMKKGNNRVNYYDCFQLMHLKSGNFLEFKRNNKDLKTYIQLTSSMSKRTLFRFIPSFSYQTENSTDVFFFLSLQIACGEKNNDKEKFMGCRSDKHENTSFIQRSILDSLRVQDDPKNEIKEDLEEINPPGKSIFDGENLKNTIKEIYKDDENLEEKIIDEFVCYSIKENILQKNFGSNMMPEEDYIIMDYDQNSFWRLINLSEDYFEDVKYLNLFDHFCIQSPDKNLFINVNYEESEEQMFLGDNNIYNTKIELKPIKEEDEKEENKSEIKEDNNIINTEINKNYLSINQGPLNIKNLNNSVSRINQIQLDYFYQSNVNLSKPNKLFIESYVEKEHLKPYSLFRFEPINEDFEKGEYGFGSLAKFSVLGNFVHVRIFNTFTNKVLYAEKVGRNKYILLLIDDIEKDDLRYRNTIFQIEKLDSHDEESEESKSDDEENKDNEDNNSSNNEEENEKKNNIKKNNYIKIFSIRYHSYLGIRTKNENNCGELVLTNSIADIARFKLNCLDEEDKHEANFFEQLLLGFNNILNFFKQENRDIKVNGKNYEKITHILNKFKNKLDMFQKDESEDSNLKLQENKFDFLEIIKHFNIVSKLIEIFLTNWFQNYQLYTYNQLEEKLKKYFQENKDILKYKLIITKVILEILTKIYNLKQCYLNVIEDSLLFFLMFVGRYDNCTKFLIDILKDNSFLLISLVPLYKDNLEMNQENIEVEESINEYNSMSMSLNVDNDELMRRKKKFKKLKYFYIKKCFERIINDYNSMDFNYIRTNFYTLILFFLFMNVLLIYRDESFKQFFTDYFINFNLLKEDEGNRKFIPNYEENPLLIYFYLKDGEIYARKTPFINNGKVRDEKFIEHKLIDLIDIMGNYNLDTEEDRNKIFFAKLVNINLIFYSNLSICAEKFKYYLQETFKLEKITDQYLTFNYNMINNSDEINYIPKQIIESPLLNETKCSVIQMLTFLYLMKSCPYISKTHLFKSINGNSVEESMEVNLSEMEKIMQFISDIFEEEKAKLEINKIDQICLIQFIELIKFVLRNLYTKKNNKEESIRYNIYYLIQNMVKLLEKLIGISEKEIENYSVEEKKREKEQKNKGKNKNEIRKKKSLNDILQDKLELRDPMFLVSENFEYVFLRIRKKIEKMITKPKETINEVNLFLNILRDICDSNLIQKTRYDLDLAKVAKQNKKLLKRFDLKSVLMNISVYGNRNDIMLFNSILYRIEQIIKEFLQYLEYSTMGDLGKNFEQNITKKDYEKKIKLEILNNNISSKYLDEFRDKIYNNKESKAITICFFKFLQVIDNEELRKCAMEILFYLNSFKNLFYYNVNNLVIMDDVVQYTKFLYIKNVFVELFKSLDGLSMAPRLDKNSIVIIEELSKNITDNLLKELFNEDDWTEENNVLNKYDEFKFRDKKGLGSSKEEASNSLNFSNKDEEIIEEDDKEEDPKSDKEGEIKLIEEKKYDEEESKKSMKSLNQNKDIFDSLPTIEEKSLEKKRRKRHNTTNKYFMNEFDDENLKIFQQTLYNLDFIDFVVEFFSYVDKLTELKEDLEGELVAMENAIIAVYKILSAFIHKNDNTQSFIKLRLYLLICPLKFKNISDELLYSINYFIYHLVYNFKSKVDYAKISFIDKVIDELYLLHKLDWNKHKGVMPYFFKTLLMFFEYSTPEHIFSIFTLIDDIKNIVVNDIENDNYDDDDDKHNGKVILIKLLEFITNEHKKKESKELKEYKNRPLLSMSNIIKITPKLIELLIPRKGVKLKDSFINAKPLILIVNLIMDYYEPYYKYDIEQYKNDIFKSFTKFCREIPLKEEYIYTKKNDQNYLNYFNEFMGISLLNICIFLSIIGFHERCIEIFEKSCAFYNLLYRMLNQAEVIFLEEKHKESIQKIFETIEGLENLHSLELIIDERHLFDDVDDEASEEEKESSIKITKENILPFNDNNIEEDEEEKNNFIRKANKEVEHERKIYITKLFYFLNYINKDNIHKSLNNKDVSFYSSFCDSYTQTFGNYILKFRIFFLYWTNIYIMNYIGNKTEKKENEEGNEEELIQENSIDKLFEDDNPIHNKNFFYDLSFVEYTIEYFEKMNLNINNYENLLYIKFLDNYLSDLDEENSAEFLSKIIDMPESRNLFHILHNILDNLNEIIKCDMENKIFPKGRYLDICPSGINEKKINAPILVLKFLTHLSENNNFVRNKMKDYLRLQYNNSKNHNFLIIVSDILSSFSGEDNIKLIPKYFDIIISITEFLTKCCSGTCKENQDCIVKHTNVLDFIKFILNKLIYRKKLYDLEGNEIKMENELNQNNEYIIEKDNRRMFSYLKYKLLLFLNVLTVGRKKGDKIYDLVHQVIDFDILKWVLLQTYKEILIECNAKKNPEKLIYEQDMLNRFNDLDEYLNDPNGVNNFIIYEIGTFAYLLINVYTENLTRPIDSDNQTKILEIKQALEKKKCIIIEKSHFTSFVKSMRDYYDNLKEIFKKMLRTCGNCFQQENNEEDFKREFKEAFSFYFHKTPHIEILHDDKIYKYYIKLSPICDCLTPEMKDEFHKNIDRASARTKIADLFKQVEFFRFTLIINKKILDTFRKAPILNLIFNHYKFYRNIFLMFAVIINILIFMSFYRTTDDEREVTSDDYDLHFDYGFLYRKDYIEGTKKTFLVLTIIELVLAVLILINYFIFRISYFIYYEDKKDDNEEEDEEKKKEKKIIPNLKRTREIFKFLVARFGNFILNIISDVKLIYHLFLLLVIILTLAMGQRYKILSILLLEIIERSNTLMCIVKSFWIPKKQIIVTLILFYLVAYYFIILVYLFIPSEVPKHDCMKFSDCYFTLCDQSLKNSNGIINYLIEDGLYTSDSLWGNPRFWIDNWFAILDIMLVMQMFCGIIIDTFLSQRENNRDIDKDKNNVCFICGLNKNELNKYYSSEFGFNEHIKLDHYLWNYMFAVFNVTTADESRMINLDKAIKRGYETNVYSSFVPYKKCFNQIEIDSNKKENEDEDNDNEEKEQD